MIVFHRKKSTNPVVETSYWLPIGFQRNVRTYFCLISCVISVGCLFFRRTRPVCLMPEPGASGARAKLIDKSTFGSKSRLKGLPFERASLPASLFLRYLGRIIPGWDPAERLRPSGGPVSARSQHHRRARRCKGNHLHRRIRPIHSRPGSRGLGYPGASLWIHNSSPASHRRCRARIQSPHPRPGKPDRESWTRRLSSAGEGAGKWPSSRKSTGGTRATGSPATPTV